MLVTHGFDEQTHCFYHNAGIRSLDGDDYIGKILLYCDTEKFHDRLNHSKRCVSIFIHHSLRQRTVVHTDSDSRIILFAYVKKMNKALFEFGLVLTIVTRVYTDSLNDFSCFVCYLRIKMHISNKRYCGKHLGMNLF